MSGLEFLTKLSLSLFSLFSSCESADGSHGTPDRLSVDRLPLGSDSRCTLIRRSVDVLHSSYINTMSFASKSTVSGDAQAYGRVDLVPLEGAGGLEDVMRGGAALPFGSE